MLAKKNAEEMRAAAIRASEQYLTALAEEKQAWGDCEEYRKICINNLRESEESRIEFVKKIMEKHGRLEEKGLNAEIENLKFVSAAVANIKSSKEAAEFAAMYLNIPQTSKEEWISYELWKKRNKEAGKDPLVMDEAWISSEVPYVPMQSSLALIKTVIYYLLPIRRRDSVDIKPEMHNQSYIDYVEDKDIDALVELLGNSKTWYSFFQVLDLRKHVGMVEKSSIISFSNFFDKILTVMKENDSIDYMIFYKIINISHEIYTFDEGKKFLFKYIFKHPLFQVQDLWRKTIETMISARVVSEKEIFYRNKERMKRIKAKAQLSGKFSEKVAERNSTIMFISQFNFYMVNLKVPLETAYNIISECFKKSKLEPEKAFPLVLELFSLNPEFKLEPTNRCKGLRVSSKIRGRWGAYLYLGVSVEFLSRHDIIEVLLVCKTWNTILTPWYLQKCLLEYKDFTMRSRAWEYTLCKPFGRSYQKIVENLNNNPSIIKSFEDVIVMDILRSYSTKPDVDSQALKEVLRIYAFFQNKVGYCQGMNYIAGTLFQVFKDKSKTFWAMDEMIRINAMQELYSEDLPKLKFLFFVLDRLIAHLLQDIYETFKAENITSCSFASPWFLTLYGALLAQNLSLQLRIWDCFIFVIFIQKGWKIIFKVAITILKRLKLNILYKRYEDIMCLLTGLQTSSQYQIFSADFIDEALTCRITNRMLLQLRRDFDKLKLR